LYSDVQATLRDGTVRDLVQKAYPISNHIAAGFAGSVKIGFMLLQSLADYLEIPEEIIDQVGWDPVFAATRWAPLARHVFRSAEAEEQKLGSMLLLVGVSPTEASGLGAKVYFVRFASPDFHPQFMSRPVKICSIGIGAGVREYKHSIKPLFRLTSGILKAEIGRPGGWGWTLGFSIANKVARSPRHGISRHLHTIIVERGRIRVFNTDEDIWLGETKNEIRMPNVARGYEEFLALVRAAGHQAEGALC